MHQTVDPKVKAMKSRMKEMEEETEKLKQMHVEIGKLIALGALSGISANPSTLEGKKEMDDRSVYVGNVDYGATPEELQAHFRGCGGVSRVTILRNKLDGRPKGFAYVEFGSKALVETALAMHGTFFRGRPIKVMSKRTNQPGMKTTNRFPTSFRGGPGRAASGTRAPPCCQSTCRCIRQPM